MAYHHMWCRQGCVRRGRKGSMKLEKTDLPMMRQRTAKTWLAFPPSTMRRHRAQQWKGPCIYHMRWACLKWQQFQTDLPGWGQRSMFRRVAGTHASDQLTNASPLIKLYCTLDLKIWFHTLDEFKSHSSPIVVKLKWLTYNNVVKSFAAY